MFRRNFLVLIAFSLLIGIFLTANTVLAQSSVGNEVRVRVGNPPDQGPSISCNQPPPPTGQVGQAITSSYGITMNGFGEQHLLWAWEKFCESSNTKFLTLIKGSVVAATSGISQQVGCGGAVSVRLGAYPNKDLFKFILTHELGHVVRNCNARATIQYNEHINAFNNEGAVSYYGGHAVSCTGSDNLSEDYADMIAYYVNPSAGIATAKCDPSPNPPNPFFVAKSKPLHHTVAQGVLNK